MSRPFYESPKDRGNEKEVVQKWLKEDSRYFVRKLRTKYILDFGVFEKKTNKMVAAVEVRCRNVSPDAYPDIMCNLLKHRAADMFNDLGIPTYFLVRFESGEIYSHKYVLDNGHYEVKLGGRTDRNDWEDIEPILCVPMKEFNKI